MRKMIGTIAVLGFLAAPALAATGTDPNPNNGNDNGYHSGQVNPGAQCDTGAASGAFGAFSHGYIPTNYDTPRGADGQQTGINNSGVCGNRANAPGQLP